MKNNFKKSLLTIASITLLSAGMVTLVSAKDNDKVIQINEDEITYIETETANIKIITGTTPKGTPYTDVITEAKDGQVVTNESYDETFTYDVVMKPFKPMKEEK